ncbi:tyrosine-type recombinase/integrase [Vibrio diabolicus]
MAAFPARDLDELEKIIRLMDDINPLISMMIEMEVRTGLRYCDISKLKFSDVMINGVIRSSFTIVQSKGFKGRMTRGKSEKAAKEAARITIYVNAELEELIKRIYLHNGHNELMFQSNHHLAKKGNAISIQYINRAYKRIAMELRLPYQLSTHSMRKMYAMLLLEKKASLKVIKDALGHSSVAVTDHYLRTFHDEAKEYTTGISLKPKAE